MNEDPYLDSSKYAFSVLREADTEIQQDKTQYVRIVSGREDVEAILLEPLNRQIFCVIFNAKLPREKKREYAERLGVSPQSLSMYVSDRGNFRAPSREVLFVSLLLREQALEIHQIDHILMELGYPGLYDDTWDALENRRNRLTRLIFEFAREKGGTTESETEWRLFLRQAFRYCGLRAQDDAVPPADEEKVRLFERWRREVNSVNATDFAPYRCALRERLPGTTTSARHQYILNRIDAVFHTYWELTDVRNFFSSSTNRKARMGRGKIIEIGTAMHCDMGEVNRMLREAGFALLYPRRADPEELRAIRLILSEKNKI